MGLSQVKRIFRVADVTGKHNYIPKNNSVLIPPYIYLSLSNNFFFIIINIKNIIIIYMITEIKLFY